MSGGRSRTNQAVTTDQSKLVIGLMQVRMGALAAQSQTGVSATSSNLDSSDSLGALQNASIVADVTTKEHTSGYPAVVDLVITEAANLAVEVSFEEFGNTKTQPLIDAMLDSIESGTVYTCSLECVAEFANGGVKSFWIPNAIVEPAFNFAPGNDWAATPVKFTVAAQTGEAVAEKMIYLNNAAGS